MMHIADNYEAEYYSRIRKGQGCHICFAGGGSAFGSVSSA